LDIAALEAVKIFARALWVANMQGIWKKFSLSQVIDLRTTDGIPNWTTWAWSEKFDSDDHTLQSTVLISLWTLFPESIKQICSAVSP